MKIKEAEAIIKKANTPRGFRVTFERRERERGVLIGDYFPAGDEPPFDTEEEAWEMARKFAEATTVNEFVNIFVMDSRFNCVNGWRERMLRKYPYQ